MSPDSINALKEAIHTAHGCDSEHIESVALIEQSEGKIPWYGTVEVFRLIAHPKAERACAWSYCTGANQTRCFTVLEIPPVDSPQTALKAAIAPKTKRGLEN